MAMVGVKAEVMAMVGVKAEVMAMVGVNDNFTKVALVPLFLLLDPE